MTLTKKIGLLWLICMILLVSASLSVHKSTVELIDKLAWVSHTYRVETLIESVLSQLKDAETGQRGYLLTSEIRYLEPYQQSITIINDLIEQTKGLTKDNPSQQQHIKRLEGYVTEKLHELKITIDLNKSGNRNQAITIVLSDDGKNTMDTIRKIASEMKLVEEKLLEDRLAAAKLTVDRISKLTSTGSLSLLLFISVIALLMLNRTIVHLSDSRKVEAELTHLATRDSLTKLYNRRSLDHRLSNAIDRASRYSHPLSVIMIDLDFFKKINDTFGHRGGDIVLETVAATLSDSIRKSDTAARYGGEEFVIILIETPLAEAELVAEQLRKKISDQPIIIDSGEVISITASLGVASFPEHSRSSQGLLEQADLALYRAKAAGRNQIKTYLPS